MRKLLITLILLSIAVFAWRRCSPIAHSPGVLVGRDPEQITLHTPQTPISKEGWSLQPLAVFSLEARVLAVKFYSDDFTAELSPCDLVLGWGRMSDTTILERLHITQHHRFYRWRFWGSPPISESEIKSHSANMHIIPADEAITGKLRSLRVGSLVRLSGTLVTATHPKADKPWRTSLTRDDDGEGACEIVYVKSLMVR